MNSYKSGSNELWDDLALNELLDDVKGIHNMLANDT
eukprot:CAMPEP_0182435858 /NCGR_PEP_ID=MMETSP1167-20130531/77988_1 /TAXON_ID=2988 /ORGANISM="Mallomonas Sp, Strain CCMP3275" /LENGTH=35 /DNA_ID= /DNA_START= /DNA_END= /DNA_ORIENTATION=